MAEAADLLAQLFSRQNRDGGWGCGTSSSWTEPTALAILALQSLAPDTESYARAGRWLLAQQLPDGGWGPNAAVPFSTSVTSTACLAVSALNERLAQDRASTWILNQVQPDRGVIAGLAFWLEHMPPQEAVMGGSPWFPGTAAWVAPTVMSVLALADSRRHLVSRSPRLTYGIERGRQYLLSRQCSDGGWNHGGTQFRSESAQSYPEMTGMALLALDGLPATHLDRTLDLAARLALSPGSAEAQSWLALALCKHGRSIPAPDRTYTPHNARDLALRLLALTPETGSNKFHTPTHL